MIKSWSVKMTKFARAAVSPAFRSNLWGPNLWGLAPTGSDREWRKLAPWALARAWLVRLSRRGTLAYYRARHRPLAGPPPGARLPQ
jgi:hypothetical protein